MFNSISWLDFLYGMAIVIGSYYTITALLASIKEIPNKNSTKPTQPAGGDGNPPNMMGAIKPDLKGNRNNSTVGSNQIIIAPEEVQNQPVQLDVQAGPSVSDLLQEIKSLTKIIQDNNGTEAESVPMYKELIQRNAHLASGSYKEVINKFLHDQCTNVCGFKIDVSEIRLWWSNK